jgi:hypothetical protein
MDTDDRRYRDQAEAAARVANAIAEGAIPKGQRYAAVRKLLAIVDTLEAWTPDDRRD